jgi:hypothetical protein
MFKELTEELLDLSATVRGHSAAMYAVNEDTQCSSSSCTIVLCCHLCW